MKHFYISLFLFISILAGGVFSNVYTQKIIDIMSLKAKNFCTVEAVSERNEEEIKMLKDNFYSKKDMLQLFINKEHIKEIEIDILLLENAVINKDADMCREQGIEIVILMSHLKDNLVASD